MAKYVLALSDVVNIWLWNEEKPKEKVIYSTVEEAISSFS